eukprot:g10236.t1
MLQKPVAVADPKDIDWDGGWKTYGEIFSGKVAEVAAVQAGNTEAKVSALTDKEQLLMNNMTNDQTTLEDIFKKYPEIEQECNDEVANHEWCTNLKFVAATTTASEFAGNAAAASSRGAPVAGRGRTMASFSAPGREKSTLTASAQGPWHPQAFLSRGQRASSPWGGVRCLSSQEKEGQSKEEEEGSAGKEEEGGGGEEGDGGDEADEESLREELAKTSEQLKDTREKALYLAAEMENVRSIAKRDAESARLYAVQKFAKQLLDVADNLERAIASAKEAGEGGGDSSHDVLLQGVEMTSQELTKVFRSQGLEKYGEVADKFDPHLHDAMFEFEDPAQEPGTLGQVLKCGYKLHGRVIRAAQVGTVKAA